MSGSKRIVIVDDNADIRYMVSEMCQIQGWEPVPCAGHVDVRALLESGKQVDLFVVDYHMPEVDGVELVRFIRSHMPRIPIIALTVEERESVLKRFMEAGANDYALKPIKVLDLFSRINVHLLHNEQIRHAFNDQKGISTVILRTVIDFLANQNEYVDISQIAKGVSISHRTIYRYLRHMQDTNMLDVCYDYGNKLGRPKTYYRLLRSYAQQRLIDEAKRTEV